MVEHLAEAAARFCQETQCWRVEVEADTTQADEQFYELDLPSGTVLEAVINLEIDGRVIRPMREVLERPAKTLDERGTPVGYATIQDNQLQFYPTPDGVYTFRGLVAVKPKLTATGVEEFVYQTWGRSISYGAVATLKMVPGKAWTDPAMGAAYMKLFDKGVVDCKRRDYRNTPLRVHGRPFA